MIKYFKIFVLFLSFVCISCNSDDAIDSLLLNNSYEEPNLDFNLLDTELYNILGEPAFIFDTVAKYSSDIPGVSEHVYYFGANPDTPDDFRFRKVDVRLEVNQNNFDFMLNWLTAKYGKPEITVGTNTTINSYHWVYDLNVYIGLIYIFENSSVPDVSILKVSYTFSD